MTTIQKAKNVLIADSDTTIKQMIDLIKNADKTNIIDYIDGVQVCEELEFTLTCEQFLKLIA